MRHLCSALLGLFVFWQGVAPVLAAGRDTAMPVNHRFRHLTIEHGLSQSSVNCLLQDRFGFVWLGTQDGLNRHDGYDFMVWKTEADDALTLSDSYITAMAEDPEGHLWVGSEASGFARFNRIAQRFDFLCTGPQRAADAHGTNYGVQDLVIDPQGRVWVGTAAHGLLCHDPATGGLRTWRQADGDLPSDSVTALHHDPAGWLWVGTESGLARLDLRTGQWRTWPLPARDRQRGPALRIEALAQSAAGELWVGTAAGLHRWDWQEDRFTDLDTVTEPIQSIATDGAGQLWLGSEGLGIIRLDPRTGEKMVLQPDLRLQTSLQTGKIQALMVDEGGVVWVGHDLGASLLDTQAKQFFHFNHQVDDPASLSHNTVWSFCEDRDGLIWVGTEGGLNRFDPRTGAWKHLAVDPAGRSGPSGDKWTAIHQDRSGAIWLGHAHGALNIHDPATGRFRHVVADSTGRRGAPSLRVYAFVEAPDGVLWMATYAGLQSYDPRTGLFTGHWDEPGGLFDLGGNACKSLQIDDHGVIWVGTWGLGVLAIDLPAGTRRHFRHAVTNSQTITSDTILSLLLDSSGRVWVGTGSGLTRLDPATGLGVRLTEKSGLPNNTIYAMSEDREGRIWASTNFGLVSLDPVTLEFRHFQAKDGLQSNEFNMGAATGDRTGRLYFGGINGFNVFYPESISRNSYVPPVRITDFQINNQRILAGQPNRGRDLLTLPIYQTETIALDHRDHVVSFSFTALHFAAPEKIRYAYRLVGFDSEWTEVGGHHRATYTNLPAGSYELRVRGSNSDGVWNEAGASLRLRVRPPFYRTAWFMILVGLVGLVTVNGIIRYRTRLMKVRTRDLEKMVARRTADLTRANHFLQQEISERRRMEEALRVAKEQAEDATRTKSEFLANMSHEIRTPMNGVLGMTSVLLDGELSPEHREHLEVVYASARNLLNIINDIMDFSKIEAGKLELENIDFDLRDLFEELAEMLGPRARDKGLDFSLHIDQGVPIGLRGDPVRIRQVLINLVANAVKFTEQGAVSVGVDLIEQTATKARLQIKVQDTGIGISADRMDQLFESFSQVDTSTTRKYGGTGLGLAICKQLVELMSGEIEVHSTVGEGTTFLVRLDLPVSQLEQVVAPLGDRVLVIMPDPQVRASLVEVLIHLGCEPVAPEVDEDPGLVAVLALGRHPGVRAVLTGGWNEFPATRQVPRKLQAALGQATPPCLAVVNLGESFEADQIRAAGFHTWVNRPLRSRKLREVLNNLQRAGRLPAGPVVSPDVAKLLVTPPPVSVPKPARTEPAATTPPVRAPRPAATGVAAAVGGLPLLLAEDNPVNQKVASILLRKLGYQVDVVDNGAEAVAALAGRRYALIFMDVQMPEMDGYEAVRRIRAGQDGVLEPRVPIIALTAHAMKGDRERCLEAGMDDYLAKPIDQKALVGLLERYLGRPEPAVV